MGERAITFRGGIHPLRSDHHGKRFTAHLPVEKAEAPRVVAVPLMQHIGAPCKTDLAVGDTVMMGQKIGESQGFVSIPVHASVSGTVRAVEMRLHPSGSQTLCVVIENDFQDTLSPDIRPYPPLEEMEPQAIVKAILAAGIAGMGGAAFPTHVKLSPPSDKKVDTLIINGAECEPFLTADHRLMVERADDVIYGTRALMRSLGLAGAAIGIELNKPDAIKALREAAAATEGVRVIPLRVKYPQGAEKQLIQAVTGREVPSGKLPSDVGCVVQNVGTAAAVAKTLRTGVPLIERVVTMSGYSLVKPRNLLVRIGTPVSDLIRQCGGMKDDAAKIIVGGLMMGVAQYREDIPVIKGTSGVLVMPRRRDEGEAPGPCLRCGRCADACPMHLQPMLFTAFAEHNDLEATEKNHVLDCIECGCCTYLCPARRHMVQTIRSAKRKILAAQRKAKAESAQ